MSDIQAGQAEAVTDAGAAAPTETTQETKPQEAPKGPSLAETIRQAREEREGRARAQSEAHDLKSQVEKLAAENAKLRQTIDPRKDAVAWAKSHNLSKEEQAEVGQTLLYDLVPEKAPPNFRVKLLEGRIAREEAERDARAEKARQDAVVQANQRIINDYQTATVQAARSFAEGSHPESEAWFGGDRDTWARSLQATAANLAASANKAGQQVDLSPANVARVLEADIAARMAARDKKRGGAPKNGQEGDTTSPGGAGSPGSPTSTKNLGSGAPRGKAQTDKERIARAIAAGFPSK